MAGVVFERKIQGVNYTYGDKYVSASIEMARVLSIIWIVILHATRQGWGSGGVIVFLAISIGLIKPDKKFGLCDITKSRAKRLIIPWLAWCAIYGSTAIIHYFIEGNRKPLQPSMLLYGPEIHLWFLPFLFLTTVIAIPIAYNLPRNSNGRRLFMVAALTITCIIIFAMGYLIQSGIINTYPFVQWAEAAPGFGLGVFYLVVKVERNPKTWIMLMAMCVLVCDAFAWRVFGSDFAGPIACAVVALAATWLLVKFEAPSGLRAVASLTFGVYLGHILVLRITSNVFRVTNPTLNVLFAIVGSAVLAVGIRYAWRLLGFTKWQIV